jgi:hypothetical protein
MCRGRGCDLACRLLHIAQLCSPKYNTRSTVLSVVKAAIRCHFNKIGPNIRNKIPRLKFRMQKKKGEKNHLIGYRNLNQIQTIIVQNLTKTLILKELNLDNDVVDPDP